MHYIGSKEKLLPFIYEQILKHNSNLESKSFCDLFAGTAVVGNFFKAHCKTIISNDVEYYSYVINHAYLNTPDLDDYERQLAILNCVAPKDGFISENYSPLSSAKRFYFSTDNAMRIDAIRQEIQSWYEKGAIDRSRYMLLLATLLESVTYISNTASIYSAFLKRLKKTAAQPLTLTPLKVETQQNNSIYNEEAAALIQNISGDILYLDPPYNLRQYGANYHLLNTIARYEKFDPKGRTGLPEYYSSPYSKRKHAFNALKSLLEAAQFQQIYLSYSSEGIVSNEEIATLMKGLGEYAFVSRNHKRFNSKNPKQSTFKTREYLHILHKGN